MIHQTTCLNFTHLVVVQMKVFPIFYTPTFWLTVENAWFYTPGGSPNINKYMVYTKMYGSPTINVMVYSHFVGSPKLKVYPFTLFSLDSQKNNTID